jgi:THO complex subunit 4
MAARFLDMALDDVAKSRSSNRSPAGRRGGRGGGGRDSPNNRSNRNSPYQVKNNMREFEMEST